MKRLFGGSSPHKTEKYKKHFYKIMDYTSKGKTNKKKKEPKI